MLRDLPSTVTQPAKTPVPGNRLSELINDQGIPQQTLALLDNEQLKPFVDKHAILTHLSDHKLKSSSKYRDFIKVASLSYWLTHFKEIPNELKKRNQSLITREIVRNIKELC